MTLQAFSLLIKLKRAQQKELYSVSVDNLSSLLSTNGCDKRCVVDIKMEDTWDSVNSRIEYLCSKGLLRVVDQDDDSYDMCVKLTHAGFHYVQTILTAFGRFLFRSILVPIVVSIFTTLITIWLNSVFNLV